MIKLNHAGVIRGPLYSLGPAEVPSILLDGDHPVLFDAGVYALGPHYLGEIRKVLGDRMPEYLLLTHMHYDHCGAAGYLKRMFPELKIGASPEGSVIITKPSAIDLITRLNNISGDADISFEPFTVDQLLGNGDVITVAENLHVEIIKTPGHTRDMLTYYIPEMKAMIPSESVGVPGSTEYIFSEFLIDYDIYMDSLKKLQSYDVDIMIIAHGVYLTGEDARSYIPKAIDCTVRFRDRLESLIRQNGEDFESIALQVKKEEYDILPGPKQPEKSYLINLNAKIRTVARHMKEAGALK